MSLYNANSIRLYHAFEHIRFRPGMYIGGVDQAALHCLIDHILDCFVGMALEGSCNEIEIILQEHQTVSIHDDSGGLPLDFALEDLRYAELAILPNGYQRSYPHYELKYCVCGLGHGHHMGVVNALSEWMTLDIKRDGFLWRQHYKYGVPTAAFQIIRDLDVHETWGNIITFRPDFSILQSNDFDFDTIATRCQEVAYTVPNLQITLQDERFFPIREERFWEPTGIHALLNQLRGNANPLHPPIYINREHHVANTRGKPYTIQLEVLFQYIKSPNVQIQSFINTLSTPLGGTHVDGLKDAFIQHFRDVVKLENMIRGLIAIVNVCHPDPCFESFSIGRLKNEDIQAAMMTVITKVLEDEQLNQNQALLDHFASDFS